MTIEEISFQKAILEIALEHARDSVLNDEPAPERERFQLYKAVAKTTHLLATQMENRKVVFSKWWTLFSDHSDAAQYLEAAAHFGDEVRLTDAAHDAFNDGYLADEPPESGTASWLNTFAQLVGALEAALHQNARFFEACQPRGLMTPLFAHCNAGAGPLAITTSTKSEAQ